MKEEIETKMSQVIQWWWFGTAAKQTYESCLDFTVTDNSLPPLNPPIRGRSWR